MHPIFRLFLALLLAHLAGDFPFQFNYLARRKQHGLGPHFLHGFIHLVLLLLVLRFFLPSFSAFGVRTLSAIAIYILLHIVIDVGKGHLVRRLVEDSTSIFLADQALHIGTIALLTAALNPEGWQVFPSLLTLSPAAKDALLSAAVVYTAVVFAGGYLIRYLTRSLLGNLPSPAGESPEQLKNAGLYIGWLERVLIVTAVILRSPTLIGLILTGKSIARFPEMKEPKFAEYFLIGTLLSISLALFGGVALLKFWYGSVSLR